ncbi:MAG: hypothetical protein NT068_01895 [Candidatus Nomurabacteria bacterium]|nr:hypothetical protein [Candidatus Nomurabacteria bacterium]
MKLDEIFNKYQLEAITVDFNFTDKNNRVSKSIEELSLKGIKVNSSKPGSISLEEIERSDFIKLDKSIILAVTTLLLNDSYISFAVGLEKYEKEIIEELEAFPGFKEWGDSKMEQNKLIKHQKYEAAARRRNITDSIAKEFKIEEKKEEIIEKYKKKIQEQYSNLFME